MLKYSVTHSGRPRARVLALRWRMCLIFLLSLIASLSFAQAPDSETPVPIFTGNIGYFTNVQGGQNQLVPEAYPVLLLPLGDNWLIESRGEFVGDFQRKNWGTGPYGGAVDKELDYLEADYIANPYVTITVGRFLTPFGIYNERLYPFWIRDLETTPLIYGLEQGSSNGAMLRGGFPLNAKINLNYAVYASTLTTTEWMDSDRLAGARMGFFLPGPRIEAGFSFQHLLQDERSNAFGFHFAWQPAALPLNLRSEYARSHDGSGYWVEGAYRLSQLPFWRHAMRRTEFVGRGQQFFVGPDAWADADSYSEYSLPYANTREGDFGFNYYLIDGLRASASYGRQFSPDGNLNVWSVGIAYRFAVPLGRAQ
jgi:hypothetical protein